jgi:hypothetical protein
MPDRVTAVAGIRDANDPSGFRMVQKLRKQGRLFYAGEMYVYYEPTHWKKP